ncbi:MAG: hypothetical protein NTU70_07225 [Methylococcales bacterium]|nr:hypothetical protein [Methylococcales bacterium]
MIEFSLAQLLSHTNDFDLQIKHIINGSIQEFVAEVTMVEINDMPRPKNIKRPKIEKLLKKNLLLQGLNFKQTKFWETVGIDSTISRFVDDAG